MTTTIEPDMKLDLRGSEALAEALRARRGTDVAVNLSRVEQFGAHAAQTILVAHRSWEADRQSLTVEAPSAAVTDALAGLGLAGEPPFSGEI